MQLRRFRTLTFLSVATVATAYAVVQTTVDPRAVLQKINQMSADFRAQQAKGATVSEPEHRAAVAKVVKEAVNGVDPSKVNPSDGMEWMQLFQMAGDEAGTRKAAVRGHSQSAFDLTMLEAEVLKEYLANGDFIAAKRLVRNMDFTLGPSLIGHFFTGVSRSLHDTGLKKPQEVDGIYDALLERVHLNEMLDANDRQWAPNVYGFVASEKFGLRYEAGNKEAALKDLKALGEKLATYSNSQDNFGGTAKSQIDRKIAMLTSTTKQSAIVGEAAPELKFDRTLGTFKSLGDLKGKVVLLDFMAHWCGPCKAAFPDLVALQNRLGAKGVQVVSLTGFYGYFGAKQGLSKDAEYEAMKGFVKDFKLAWPVIFDATGTNQASYGVQGIPQLVVIDREGKVRKVEVGYTKESFAETVKLVESLL